ncbi:ABC transporter substrate-binding protein [Streptomonospora salina]|uniref:Iron complex transport system substrate-binding protein n=1 Tax=Streptomonospora salina TaxID=104205 RepID=A0A841ECI8_9ACTN|nr:ABC transporter substrate-binding protein [Streptomonospora salina]MBB5998180.1 iron complex transport system substrate-binding protein [Streptomonospora salina]
MTRVSARPLRAAGAFAGALLLAGCGAPAPEQPAGEDATTRTNCGIDVAVDAPPERVYAAYQPGIEVAHALGLSDRLVGTAFLDAQVLDEYADEQAATDYVPTLPSREGLLETEPGFVISGFNGFFAENGSDRSVGTRAGLRELGVQSWILSPLCPSEDGLTDRAIDPASVTVDSVYRDLRDLGALFGAEDDAEQVISDMRERIAAVQEQVEGAPQPSVAIVSPGDDGGYRVAGGIDFSTRIIEHAGGANAFADLTEKRNIEVGAEEIVARDPDVILTSACCDAGMTEQDAESDVDAITADPALEGVTAVADDEVHPFLFADRSAGVRAAHSIELVASRIHPDLVER